MEITGARIWLLPLLTTALCSPASASDLTRGKKALFTEDFELDIYEWTVTENGATEGEDPDLVRRDDAFQGNNVLLLSGKQGMLELELTRQVKGIVEFHARFPGPHDYTRMFAVGRGDDEVVMLGVNRSDRFFHVIGGEMGGSQWNESDVKVTDDWHTFTYDFSGALARLYIDGQLIATDDRFGEFDRLQLGINQGRGGTCLLDQVVVYDASAEFSQDNSIEAVIPLLDWDHGLKPATRQEQKYRDATYAISDVQARSKPYAAQLEVEALPDSSWRYFHFQRKIELPGLPQKLSLWVHGDASNALFHLQFVTPNSNVNYDLGRITWTGWKKLELDLTRQSTGFYPPSRPHVIRNAGHEGTMLMSWWLRPRPGTPVRIYIDDVVLTTRLNREFPYLLHVESTAEDGVMEPGTPAEFRVRVTNGADSERTFSIDYTVRDYWGETVRRGRSEIEVEAGDAAVGRIRIEEPLPSGWFAVQFLLGIDGKTIATAVEPIAVLRPLPERVFSPDNPVGLYGGFGRLANKIGITEAYVGPERGDFRRATPEQLRTWELSGETREIIGTAYRTAVLFYHVPPWSYLPDEEMEAAAEKWADAFAVFAAKHRGLPVYYKILSEPGNTGTSYERCVQVLKYAHQGIMKGDPDARILGLNTSKFNWARQKYVWSRGALSYVYGVGVHPYTGARHGSKKPERAHGIGNLMSMLRLDDMIRRYNRGEPKPIWASEVGMDTTPGVSWGFTLQEQADYIARAAIEYKTMANFQRFHYHLMRDGNVENNHWGAFTALSQPKPLAVSIHTLAERLTGVSWLKTLHTPDNARAYLFTQRDGRQMLVAWGVDGPARLSVPVVTESVEMMDLMGVYADGGVDDGVLDLDLTESPLFVTATDGTLLVDAWIQALTRYREVIRGQRGLVLTLEVRNRSDEPLQGTLHAEVPAGMSLEPASHAVDLPPGGERELSFQLSVAANCVVKNHILSYRLDAGLPETLAATSIMIGVVDPDARLKAVRADHPPALDGVLDDAVWQRAPQITQFVESGGYPAQRGHSLRLVYTIDGLYLGTRFDKESDDVLRAEHVERDDGYLWQDEGLEVFLDPNLDRSNYFQFVGNLNGVQSDYKFEDVHMRKRDWTASRAWNGEWSIETSETDDHWSAEMFVPWNTVGITPSGQHRMGLNVSHSSVIVGEPKSYAFTVSGIPNHAVESYLSLDIDFD